MDRLVFHVDVNSAFISWEAARRVKQGEPDLRLIPSVVGGNPNRRTSIVSAKSIPAKAYGINTGEPVSMAIRKCPSLVWVEPDFALYSQCSRAFKDICRKYSPVVESFSIDEVFLDMTGMEKIYKDHVATAIEIKNTIKDELGFTVNIGIGENKFCAKMASDFEKPDKVHTLYMSEIASKMWPLPIGEMFMVGKSTAAKLIGGGIRTIGDLANANPVYVESILGKRAAQFAIDSANGVDDSPVCEEREDAKSFSIETTVQNNIEDMDTARRILLNQADVVAARLRRDEAKCKCVNVSYKFEDFRQKSHQRKFAESTDVTEDIFRMACTLFEESWGGEPIRLIGLSLSDIDRDGTEQMSLIVDDKREKLKKLDGALDSIRDRYGSGSIRRASTIGEADRLKKYDKSEEPS